MWTHNLRFIQSPGVRRTSHLTPPWPAKTEQARGPPARTPSCHRPPGASATPSPHQCAAGIRGTVWQTVGRGPNPGRRPASAQGLRAVWDSEVRGSQRPLPAHVTWGSPASSPRSSAGSRDPATLARGGERGRDLHRDVARPAPATAPRARGRRQTPREARAPPRTGPQAFHRPSRLRTGARGPGVRFAPARGVHLFPPARSSRPRGRLTALVSARRRARSSRDTARTPDMSARHSALPATPAPGRACAARRQPGQQGAPGLCACAERSRAGGPGRPRPALPARGSVRGTRAGGRGGACGRPRG